MKIFACTLVLATTLTPHLFAEDVLNLREKEVAVESIESRREEMIALSDQIWKYAETALREARSSKALADWAEREGFRVTRG